MIGAGTGGNDAIVVLESTVSIWLWGVGCIAEVWWISPTVGNVFEIMLRATHASRLRNILLELLAT